MESRSRQRVSSRYARQIKHNLPLGRDIDEWLSAVGECYLFTRKYNKQPLMRNTLLWVAVDGQFWGKSLKLLLRWGYFKFESYVLQTWLVCKFVSIMACRCEILISWCFNQYKYVIRCQIVKLNHRGRHSRDRMVVGFTITYAINAYHHWCYVFEPRSWRAVLDTTVCDNVCQWLATGLWFSPGTSVSSINKTDCHNITEILLKVALNTIKQTKIIKSLFSWNIWDIKCVGSVMINCQ